MTRGEDHGRAFGIGWILGVVVGIVLGITMSSFSRLNPSYYNPTEAYKLYQEALDKETKIHLKEIERHNRALGIPNKLPVR